jgi:hypothetical protein
LNECLLEDIIESSEKESFVSCPNIAINEEEVDKDETCNDSNCVPFAGHEGHDSNCVPLLVMTQIVKKKH